MAKLGMNAKLHVTGEKLPLLSEVSSRHAYRSALPNNILPIVPIHETPPRP